jgi:hypothetical protein
MLSNFFEALMLICFGTAWPASLYKSYTSRTAAGKSLAFLYIVLLGYAAGMAHKIIEGVDYVLLLYFLDALMVVIDIGLYYRNRRIQAVGP